MTDQRDPNDVLDSIEGWLPRKPGTKPLERWDARVYAPVSPSGPLTSPEMAAREAARESPADAATTPLWAVERFFRLSRALRIGGQS